MNKDVEQHLILLGISVKVQLLVCLLPISQDIVHSVLLQMLEKNAASYVKSL